MKKWLKRIGIGLLSALCSFVVVSIVNKLLFGYDDWLYRSIMMSAPWLAITLLKYYFVVDKGWKTLKFMLTLAGITLLTTLFVTGVCLSLSDYWEQTWYITFCCTYPTCFAALKDNE